MKYSLNIFVFTAISLANVHANSNFAFVKTPCESCHTEVNWSQAKFNHDKTTFPLKAKHVGVPCLKCHQSAFRKTEERTCGSCHKDAHTGQLGQRCEKCHEPTAWVSNFGTEGHRRTNFPLTGRHAVIPCQECHLERRDQTFSRATVACVGCHLKDYASTSGTATDHGKLGFSTNCQQCHHPSFFKPAKVQAP